MAVKIVYSSEAQIDIHKVKCHFDIIQKGEDFLDDLFYLEELIGIMPGMFQIKYRNIRIANLENFKYCLHYMFTGSIVYVYRVFLAGKDFDV